MKAARLGAAWIITPELAVSGYTFADTLGTDWIDPQPDHWMEKVTPRCRQQAHHFSLTSRTGPAIRPTLQHRLCHHPRRTPGRIHRKINALRVGSEAWSTPGTETTVFPMAPLGNVGMLICADAYSPGIANSLKATGRADRWSPRRPGLRDCMARTASGNDARKIPGCRSSCATAPEPTAHSISGRPTVWWLRTGSGSSRCPRNGPPFSSSTGI